MIRNDNTRTILRIMIRATLISIIRTILVDMIEYEVKQSKMM